MTGTFWSAVKWKAVNAWKYEYVNQSTANHVSNVTTTQISVAVLTFESLAVTLCSTRFNIQNSLCVECFVRILEQTATFALYFIKWLVFLTVVGSVYCPIRTDSLYKADYVVFKRLTSFLSCLSVFFFMFIVLSHRRMQIRSLEKGLCVKSCREYYAFDLEACQQGLKLVH